MDRMFKWCKSSINIDLSKFDIEQITKTTLIAGMVDSCIKLTTLKTPKSISSIVTRLHKDNWKTYNFSKVKEKYSFNKEKIIV